VVWVQEDVSWSLVFGISTICTDLALIWFLAGAGTYTRMLKDKLNFSIKVK
jgi:dipeptide/tripeptide permease